MVLNSMMRSLFLRLIRNALKGETLPVYGDGKNIRDWLYVEDHCKAIDLVFHKGTARRNLFSWW